MTDTFTWAPALDPTGSSTLRVRRAQFGDGYQQAVVDGINAKVESWDVTFTQPNATISAIAAFLDTHIGMSFLWTPPAPQDVQGYYQCDGYKHVPHGAGNSSLNATFLQVFRP